MKRCFFNKFLYGSIVNVITFETTPYEVEVVNEWLFNLKISDMVVKLRARNFIKISSVKIIRLGLVKYNLQSFWAFRIASRFAKVWSIAMQLTNHQEIKLPTPIINNICYLYTIFDEQIFYIHKINQIIFDLTNCTRYPLWRKFEW